MRVRVGSAIATISILACAATASANTSTPFPAGTLIIPTGAAYQDDCGAVSAYGLIYDILRANAWLDLPAQTALGYGHITIYYAFLDTKSSPNRCKPSSLDVPPSTPADPSWNDGCDFQITSAGIPAMLINNGNHNTADTQIITFNTTAKANVYPGYASRTIGANSTLGYLGGPFLVFPPDVPLFQKLLDGTVIAKDVNNNNIDFSPFRTNKGTCTGATAFGVAGMAHYVNVHRAMATFTANVGKAFTVPPPRLALLATDISDASPSSTGCGVGAGLEYDGGAAGTSKVCDGILEAYVHSAGLDYNGANGCPTSSVNAGNATICPNGANSGQIYDSFDFADLVNHPLDTTKYSMLWTPHWESRAGGSTAPTANELTALGHINTFLNGTTGLAAECASIATYEGAYAGATKVDENTVSAMQLQSCPASGSVCSGGTANWGIDRSPASLPGAGHLKNCTDITQSSGNDCAYFTAPGDPYSQTGDFTWNEVSGLVQGYQPLPTSLYKPGVQVLISAVTSLDKTKLASPATYYTGTSRSLIVGDLVTRNVKDNTPGKANVLYLAGHDQSAEVSGTKVILETLLQLGTSTLPPITTTTEVSRNSPIVATVGAATAVFQGTFEEVTSTPLPVATTFSVTGDGVKFRFPFVAGHLRARTASTITTTGTAFGSTGVLFDAALEIPSPTYSGGCSTWYTSTCRTVFTTIAAGANPAIHYLQSSELATIGPLMGPAVTPNPALNAADQGTLIQRVLAGDDSVIPGIFVPKLGGVDRSTVAVIPSSALVNSTRQTIAYFGADDGMLHAVCASTGGACDVLGRELWAYLPRTLLPIERYNTGRIDGSPRVMDMFGDFYASGTKGWHTILTFQTGTGDTTTQGRVPAVYALDVSDPVNPQVIWEYSLANVGALNPLELGVGLTMAQGQVQATTSTKNIAFAQTNNAGTGGTGSVVTAIDIEKGTVYWQTGYAYPAPRTGGHPVVPSTGIPGGAVAVDKAGNGFVTDLAFGTLYGDFWLVDPATGISRYGAGKPEMRFSTDFHPIGAQPAIYSKGGVQYAAITDGGYADPFDTNWTTAATVHYLLGVSLSAPVGDAIFDETKGAPDIGFKFAFGAGETGSAQALVVGSQVFVTTDTTDINSSTYGTTGATGHVYRMDLGTNTLGTTVIVEGGASSIANSGTTLYSGASDQTLQLGTAATSASGTSVDASLTAKVSRNLWLRSQ